MLPEKGVTTFERGKTTSKNMSKDEHIPELKTATQIRQEEIQELGKKVLPDEVKITEAELDNKNRAPKGEEFGYEK